jgi:hypothetical protein
MLECTSASDPYATYPSLSERIGINVSAVRKLIEGGHVAPVIHNNFFSVFAATLPLAPQKPFVQRGSRGGGSKVGGGSNACATMQEYAVFYAGKRCFPRKKTLFSLW